MPVKEQQDLPDLTGVSTEMLVDHYGEVNGTLKKLETEKDYYNAAIKTRLNVIRGDQPKVVFAGRQYEADLSVSTRTTISRDKLVEFLKKYWKPEEVEAIITEISATSTVETLRVKKAS